MNIQREIVAYLLATYDLTELDRMTLVVGAGKTLPVTDTITLCLAESHYFIPALLEAYNVKKALFTDLNADFSKKLNEFLRSKPLQKPTTKHSVVCYIAAKLAKHGIKNPMRVAWKIYRVAMDCLNAIARKCYFDFYALAYQLECLLVQHRLRDVSQVLPASVCNVLKRHALSLTI